MTLQTSLQVFFYNVKLDIAKEILGIIAPSNNSTYRMALMFSAEFTKNKVSYRPTFLGREWNVIIVVLKLNERV